VAIAFDAASSETADFSGSVSTSHTIGSLTNGILLIAVSVNAGFGITINTPTVGGSTTGVTLLGEVEFSGDREMVVAVYSKLSPSSGETTIAETTTGTPTAVAIATASYSGAAQTSTFGTPVANHADGTAISITVPTTAGDLVLDFPAWDTGGASRTVSVGASQTSRVNEPDGNAGAAISEETATGSSTVMAWTISSGTIWVTQGVVLHASNSGSFSLSCLAGSYAITGTTLALDVGMSAVGGSYQLAGMDVTLTYSAALGVMRYRTA
jgi:hypothetical protein